MMTAFCDIAENFSWQETRRGRCIRTGTFGVNQGYTMDPYAPFGGIKSSSYGRELGREGIESYLETTSISAARG